jgi:zinc and cadmium transporter
MHEVPQEIGDFGVLLHSGFRPLQAVLVNLVSGMVAIAGALLFLFISKHYALSVDILAGATAGAFLYVAGADLIPELHDANRPWQSIVQLLGLCIGMAIMGTLLRLE